jgi:hypothetical protein
MTRTTLGVFAGFAILGCAPPQPVPWTELRDLVPPGKEKQLEAVAFDTGGAHLVHLATDRKTVDVCIRGFRTAVRVPHDKPTVKSRPATRLYLYTRGSSNRQAIVWSVWDRMEEFGPEMAGCFRALRSSKPLDGEAFLHWEHKRASGAATR